MTDLSTKALLETYKDKSEELSENEEKKSNSEESSVENACAPFASCSTSDEHKKNAEKPVNNSIVKRTRFRRFFERFIVLIKISF